LRWKKEEMEEGELVDLIGCLQVEGGLKEDKAREYVFGALSKKWMEISNNGAPVSTLQAKQNLKHLLPVHFKANKERILEYTADREAEKEHRKTEKRRKIRPIGKETLRKLKKNSADSDSNDSRNSAV
jgi:hypothetical protein